MKQTTPLYAIVPAAGRSRRMGTAKQALPVGGRPMLEGVLAPLRQSSSITRVILVTHRVIPEKLGLKGGEGFDILINDDPETGMIDSIRMALRHIQSLAGAGERCAALIVPGDMPGLRGGDLEKSIDVWRADEHKIVIASHDGRRGHPLIFNDKYFEYAFSEHCDHGLKALPRNHAGAIAEAVCDSSSVLNNVNTPDDYDKLNN